MFSMFDKSSTVNENINEGLDKVKPNNVKTLLKKHMQIIVINLDRCLT